MNAHAAMITESQNDKDSSSQKVESGDRKTTTKRSRRTLFSIGLSSVFFLVAIYWVILYRITWLPAWPFLAMCATAIAFIISFSDLFLRRKHFRRQSDRFPAIEVLLVSASMLCTSLLYLRTVAI